MQLKVIRLTFILIIILVYVCFLNSSLSYKRDSIINNNKNSFNTVDDKNDYTEKSQEIDGEIIASIKIPKINLNKNLYSIDSKNNTVDKNVEIIKGSNMPDISNGNLILAAHNGSSLVSYFHNLYQLNINDEIIINYKNADYKYIVSDKYDVVKTGKVSIKRNKNKNTITLITCKGENEQLVVIGYLL